MNLCSTNATEGENASIQGYSHCLELFPPGEVCVTNGSKSSNKFDVSVASSRSSIKQLFDVLSSLDENKKQLVRSIGFGGLLMFPALRQINRRFSVWSMSKVDPLSQTLVIDSEKKLPFNKEDVERVFGIPSSGNSVFALGAPSKKVINKVADMYLPGRAKDKRSVKAAQDVVERLYLEGMSASDENAFRVAFVVYIMSTLLSPGSKHDYVSFDYWNALADPSEINSFDWSKYVIKRLYQAVVKVKAEVSSSNKVTNINGCSVFLQVIFLRLQTFLSDNHLLQTMVSGGLQGSYHMVSQRPLFLLHVVVRS